MERIAFIVGIDRYPEKIPDLSGCVNDAEKMKRALCLHDSGLPNFDCTKTFISQETDVTGPFLKRELDTFFAQEAEVALFYFAGHGFINNIGGFLVTQDAATYQEGVNMANVLTLANQSLTQKRVRDVILILDCCHGGTLGQIPQLGPEVSIIPEGLSILAASRKHEKTAETSDGGEFTKLVYNALIGRASDMRGQVTVPQIYSYVAASMRPYGPRPVYKSNVSKLVSLRTCDLDLELTVLRFLPELFADPDAEFQLDPSYLPGEEPEDPLNERVFSRLQSLYDSRLLTTFEDSLRSTALNKQCCRLTDHGRYYWSRVQDQRDS